MSKTFTGRARAINAVVALASVILCLAAVEIVLRMTHFGGATTSWVQPDPLIGRRYAANARYWAQEENDHPITGRMNQHGWRDLPRSLAKPADTFRVAVLGDSFVTGFDVELEKAFPFLTERKLNVQGDKKYELLNFGISGISQGEELLILEHYALKFSLDAVVLFFYPDNDIEDISRESSLGPNQAPFFVKGENGELVLDTSFSHAPGYRLKVFVNWFKRNSALIGLLSYTYNSYQYQMTHDIRQKDTAATGNAIPVARSLGSSYPDRQYQANYLLNKRLISEMARLCRERGIRFFLAVVPFVDPDGRAKFLKLDPDFNMDFFEQDLRAHAASIGAGFIDLQKAFDDSSRIGSKLNFQTSGGWGHWNYEGHQLVAERLSEALVRLRDELGKRF